MSPFWDRDKGKRAGTTDEYAIKKGDAKLVPSGGSGRLFLTNKGLIFRAGKERTVIRSSDLKDSGVRERTLRSPLLVVHTTGGELTFEVDGAKAWATAILTVRSSVVQPPPGPSAAPPAAQAGASTHTVEHHTVEREVVKVRCRYCGNLGDEREGKCASCGAAL